MSGDGHGGGVWGLDTGRRGEFLQIQALGSCLGLPFESVRLSPEGVLPAALPDGPPRLILSFGRAAQAGLRLRARFPVRPLLVHLGTPGHVPLNAFDLIIPMPQDCYPPAPNVQFLRLPLNGAAAEATALPARGGGDGTVIVVGGTSRHFRFTRRAVRRLLRFGKRLAQANGEALRVVTSPRTPAAVVDLLRRRVGQDFTLNVYGDSVPFAEQLRRGSRFLVTGDSASMVADACRSGAPVWLFPLPGRVNISIVLQRSSDRWLGRGVRHALIRRGWVGGGTDFPRWHHELERLGYVRIARRVVAEAALRWAPAGPLADTDLRDCRARILGLLTPPAADVEKPQAARLFMS